jgi:hypothetical protein
VTIKERINERKPENQREKAGGAVESKRERESRRSSRK